MLQRLPVIIERRRRVFDIYRELLNCAKEITLPPLPVEADPVCTHFPLLLNNGNREDIVRKLWALGIDPGFNFSFLCGGKDVADATPVALGHPQCRLTLPLSSRINDEMAVWIAREIKIYCKKDEFDFDGAHKSTSGDPQCKVERTFEASTAWRQLLRQFPLKERSLDGLDFIFGHIHSMRVQFQHIFEIELL